VSGAGADGTAEPSDGVEAFGQLHPSLQHHVVNSLGWRNLRPLQYQTIGPILAGDHVVATAATAAARPRRRCCRCCLAC